MQAAKVWKFELAHTLDVGDRVHVESLSAQKIQNCRSPSVARVF